MILNLQKAYKNLESTFHILNKMDWKYISSGLLIFGSIWIIEKGIFMQNILM